MKAISLIFLSVIIFLTGGCSYSKDTSNGLCQQILISKESLEKKIAENASDPIVGVWQVQRGSDTWFQLAIIPNEDQENHEFKGIITNTGSLFNKGVKCGETFLYVSKIESNDKTCTFWGIWKSYYTWGSPNWKAIRFELSDHQAKINEEIFSYDISKISRQNFPSFLPASSSSTQETKKTSLSSSTVSSKSASGYGEISKQTGRAKTVHVKGYHRKDGTYVKPHYRSPPKRK